MRYRSELMGKKKDKAPDLCTCSSVAQRSRPGVKGTYDAVLRDDARGFYAVASSIPRCKQGAEALRDTMLALRQRSPELVAAADAVGNQHNAWPTFRKLATSVARDISRHVREHLVTIRQFHAEHRVPEWFDNRALHNETFFLRHKLP